MSQHRLVVATALAVACVALAPDGAMASYTGAASGPASLGSDTLNNPATFTAACAANTSTSKITLSWPLSVDPYVTSYYIVRTGTAAGTSGTFSVAQPASGTSVTYSDTVNTTSGNKYSYTISARVQSWTVAAMSASGTPGFTGTGGKCV